MKVTIVVAMTPPPERLIGKAGGLPWHIAEDLQHFKRVTLGHAVIMGRKTIAELKKPLPGRRNLIISREPPLPGSAGYVAGVEWFTSIPAALEAARAGGESECMICGGAEIYRQVLAADLVDRMIITYVTLEPVPEGDTRFPAWEESQWVETGRQKGQNAALEFVTYERRR